MTLIIYTGYDTFELTYSEDTIDIIIAGMAACNTHDCSLSWRVF